MRLLVGASIAAIVAAACIWRLDVAGGMGGIKGDEATYVAMAASVAFDGDLEYSASDYRRIRAWSGSGPEGIFLKRSGGDLRFGKAYLYGVLAAPFAWAGLKGLLFFNVLCLIATIAAGFWWLQPGSRTGVALAYSALFAAAAVTPLYAVWLTSEILNYALVFLAFVMAWPRDDRDVPRARVWIGVALLAAAAFSKPLNALLLLPLVVGAVNGGRRRAFTLAAAVALALAFFGLNFLLTGDFNYQGGDRKTFYTRFPYDDQGGSYDTTGIRITTDQVLAAVGEEGRLATVPRNAWYFVAGRHFGVIPFGWPWVISLLLWIVAQRRKRWGEWVLVTAVLGTAVATVAWMPYTWSGGGGPIGNRYFLSVAAALFFVTPRLRSAAPVALAAVGLVFVTPGFAAPFEVTKQPWRATTAAPFRLLPLELTGASDFPIILDQRRGRVPQGEAPTVFVSFLDAEADFGDRGWMAVRAVARTELLVRSPVPLVALTVGIVSPAACSVEVNDGDGSVALSFAAGERRDTALSPPQVFARDCYAFALTIDATACDAPVQVALQGRARR